MTFEIIKNQNPLSKLERDKILDNPGFGDYFTDYMAIVDFDEEQGWHSPRIVPFENISLSPAASVLHYAQEVFEGLKAYRHADNSIYLFRPYENAKRFNLSLKRMAFKTIDENLFVDAIKELIKLDSAWVPENDADNLESDKKTLYIRPFSFADEAFLGVRPCKKAKFMVIASPAGSYFKSGVQPVDIWLSQKYIRAAKGGTGFAKTGGNYAASLLPQAEAYENGCSQVLFLDAISHSKIDELGGMNIFFITASNELITPSINGSILKGVTRDSILRLACNFGLTPVEKDVELKWWIDGIKTGEITEVFACGTAAVITPIGRLKSEDFIIDMALGLNNLAASKTLAIRHLLNDIQFGKAEDKFGWLEKVL